MEPNLHLTKDGKLFLRLPGKQYKPYRMIGIVDGRTLITERDYTRHLFRKFNAFGFSYEAIKYGGRYFDEIVVRVGFDTLKCTRHYLLKHGKILNFKRNDLEKQIFLPIDDFNKKDEDGGEDTPPLIQTKSTRSVCAQLSFMV